MASHLRRLFAPCTVVLLGVAIMALHFHALLTAPMNDVMWGISLSADPVGVLAEAYDAFVQQAHGCVGHATMHDFPFGVLHPVEFHRYLTLPLDLLTGLLQLTKKPVLSYNLTVLLIVFLNYILIYTAFLFLLRDRVVALLPAVVITFSAYSYAHSWAHLGLMPIFYFSWFLATFTRLQETGKYTYAIAAGLILALSIYTSPYYCYFILWMAVAIFLGHAIAAPRQSLQWKRVLANAFCGIVAFVCVIPFIHETFLVDFTSYWTAPPGDANFGNDLTNLLSFTARPFDYVLPNVHNILYGDFFSRFIPDQMPMRHRNSDEFPIYIGALPGLFLIALPLVVAWRPWRRRVFSRVWSDGTGGRRGLLLSLILIMLCAFLISLPNRLEILGVSVPLPNELLRHVVPFRSYSRFAIVFLTALAGLVALLATQVRWRGLIVGMFIVGCVFESMPETKLHNASAETPYIKYLRQRPERVITRFESQNISFQRVLDLEVILADKMTINGDINRYYGYTELGITPGWPRFNYGQLGQMGAELLIVNGHLQAGAVEEPYLQHLADFPDSGIEIWKIIPGSDPQMTELFQPFIDRRKADFCFVAPKDEVRRALDKFFGLLRG